ncbi:MAG TPA: NADH-quinone oxidoreductase subunit J [Bacteroidales bacterium]|nr:NADH-quinone oxidoreductase subunit J [Bacteroidales bacterium]
MEQYVFYILAAIILVFSFLTVTSRMILRAAVYLLFVLIATSGIYFMLNYNFLAAVQLTVYAGGIAVLIVFSVLLTSQLNEKMEQVSLTKALAGGLIAFAGALLTILTIVQYNFRPNGLPELEPSPREIGHAMLNYGDNGYVLPFEVISVLLLAAMVGAIIIAKRPAKLLNEDRTIIDTSYPSDKNAYTSRTKAEIDSLLK